MLANNCGNLAKALHNPHAAARCGGSFWQDALQVVLHPWRIDDGTVTKVNIEPDGTGLTCSLTKYFNKSVYVVNTC